MMMTNYIIDYKASNIDDPNYVTQLQTYIRYLSKIYQNHIKAISILS